MTTPTSRKPRFHDIALEAGVGTAMVECVLNGRGNVAPVTARRIVLAAHKLQYDRTLPSLYHALIRIEVFLVRPDMPFFARLNAAFRRSARRSGTTVLHRTFLEEDTPEAIARRIEDIAADREALIVVVQDHPRTVAALDTLAGRNMPLVLLVSDVLGAGGLYVGIDNESAAVRQATSCAMPSAAAAARSRCFVIAAPI